LFTLIVAYTGQWTVDDEKLVPHVDDTWGPTGVGTEQVRYHALKGQTLSCRNAPIQLLALSGRRWSGTSTGGASIEIAGEWHGDVEAFHSA
jgi:hypothetical protein